MNATYKIYIETQTINHIDVYRVFVYQGSTLCWLSGWANNDMHGKVYLGKVIKTLGLNKAQIQVVDPLQNFCVYTERSHQGKNIQVGDKVWVQIHSISPIEMAHKDYKGTLNIALPLGPVVLYPFETGIHISNRLKQYPEFSNSLKKHFEQFSGRMGIKFRLSAKDYSIKLLEDIISFGKKVWDQQEYNSIEFTLLNQLLYYFLYPVEAFSNNLHLSINILNMAEDIFEARSPLASIPADADFFEDAWDDACRKLIPLPFDGSISIEETSGCVVVDVNAGASSSYDSVNQDVIRMLPKILYQGKFGGKVIVDILPTSNRHVAEQLMIEFKAEWENFDASAQLYGVSKMGLLELILPRRGFPLWWIDKKILKS